MLRDITHPSFAINPDYLSYTVTLNDGRMLDGVVHTSGDTVTDRRREGRHDRSSSKSDIDEMQAVAGLHDARKTARSSLAPSGCAT